MRATFNSEGGLEIYPDNNAELRALLSWQAHYPVRSISEGTLEPMSMRPADAVVVKE